MINVVSEPELPNHYCKELVIKVMSLLTIINLTVYILIM
jgi:hypothetical protein